MKNSKQILSSFFLIALILAMTNIAFAFPITGRVIEISSTETKFMQQQACSVPVCESEQLIDTGRTDANGCEVYVCPPILTCSIPTCTGVYDTGNKDANGCQIYRCPEVTLCSIPACEGAYDTGNKDSNGCAIFRCPEVTACSIPACEGVYDTGNKDSNGCAIFRCPEVTACSIPACEGVYDTGNKDSNGCPIYQCRGIPACAIPVCKDGSKPFDTGKIDLRYGCPIYSCSVCKERPTCLDSNPACKISEPAEGWCPILACAIPACEGVYDTGNKDSNGCVIYQCRGIPACAIPVCKDGSKPFDTGKTDEKGCRIYLPCSVACSIPICAGAYDTGNKDKNGCTIYACPPITSCIRPICKGAYKTGKKDSNNCEIYACPPTLACTMPICKDGSKPFDTGKIDSNGCKIYSSCQEQACPESCTCDAETITCPTTQAKPVKMEVSSSAGSSNISFEKFSEKIISINDGPSSAKTSNKLVIEEKKLLMETTRGNIEVKVMPSTASETAINQLKLKGYEIELKDVGGPIYEIVGKKDVKIFGLINAEMSVTSQVNAETGNIEKTEKPWWSFLAKE